MQQDQRDRDHREGEDDAGTATTNVIQVNIGMRMSVMPGARMLMIVTMKLKRRGERRRCRGSAGRATQKSMLMPRRERRATVSGA